MKWTTKAPTKEGWYWFQGKNEKEIDFGAVLLRKLQGEMYLGFWGIDHSSMLIEDMQGRWAGPVKEPTGKRTSKRKAK